MILLMLSLFHFLERDTVPEDYKDKALLAN